MTAPASQTYDLYFDLFTADGGAGGFDELLIDTASGSALVVPDASGSASYDSLQLWTGPREPFASNSRAAYEREAAFCLADVNTFGTWALAVLARSGALATAVASKVGSSMSWHMPLT